MSIALFLITKFYNSTTVLCCQLYFILYFIAPLRL